MNKVYLSCLVCFVLIYSAFAQTKDVKIVQGFNFNSSDFSTPLETKVQTHLDAQSGYQNALVVGHSQGGLTGAGYVNKASGVRCFITVDSPIRGFSGLDGGYAKLRDKLFDHIRVHERAIGAVVFHPALTQGWYNFSTKEKLNLLLSIFGPNLEMRSLLQTVINKSSPDSSIREITDMGKSSDYVRQNVYDTWIEKVKYRSGWVTKWKIEFRPWPYICHYQAPVYSYRDVEHYTNKLNPFLVANSLVGHVVGTDNDPLHMDPGTESENREMMRTVKDVYNAAGATNVAAAVLSFPVGSPYFANQADRAFRGARWIDNYKSEWGDILGGGDNDAFITVRSQTLPTTRSAYIRQVYVDHAHSTPPGEDKIKADNFSHEGTRAVWGEGGSVHQISNAMGHKYFFD